MKRNILTCLILTALLCFVLSPAVIAQQRTRRTPESRVEELNKAVNLSAEQQKQVMQLYSDAQQGGGGRGGFGGGGTTAALEKILTPEQLKKWNAYNLQQSVDRRITQIDEAVTLTDEQKKKIVPIIQKEINATNAVTAEMRAQGQNADFQSMMEKRTALRAETDKALGSILTKEQMSAYSAMPTRGGRGGRGGF